MVSRALRIFGLLLLVSGTAAARDAGRTLQRGPAHGSFTGAGWSDQLGGKPEAQRSPRAQSALRHVRGRDATGRVWSHVELGVTGGGSPARTTAGWTTQRLGSWTYSYSSDGTRCVSQRTAESVLIRCQ